MQYFNSTAIQAAKYDFSTGTFRLWFASSGQAYDYYQVPSHVWEGLLVAPSKGQYFNAYIRDQYAA